MFHDDWIMLLKHACTKVGNMFENTNARIYARKSDRFCKHKEGKYFCVNGF